MERRKLMRKFEYVEIEKIKPHEKNARTHSEEQIQKIAESIREFGFLNPILIDENYMIIAGHGRLLGAKKLGLLGVPCIFVEDLNEAQKSAYIIADNRLAEDAGWDMSVLSEELRGLMDIDFDIELTGFTLDDIELDFGEAEVKESEIPELKPEPKSKVGEIYQLGKHRLMCGDSTCAEDVEKLMSGVRADLLLTDPPYNVDYTGKNSNLLKIENDNMSDEKFEEFLKTSFYNADCAMRPGAAFYIWHSDSKGYSFRAACLDVDWQVRQCLIWNKNSMVLGRQDYNWKHEPCLYGWKKGASHFWASDRKQTTVMDFEKPQKSEKHPTMKPVSLFDYQIKNNTKKGDVVLDIFGGSGTTLIACEQNGRPAYLMELSPSYVDVIIERWEDLTGQKAKKLN